MRKPGLAHDALADEPPGNDHRFFALHIFRLVFQQVGNGVGAPAAHGVGLQTHPGQLVQFLAAQSHHLVVGLHIPLLIVDI
jgi:hypothetical protein